MAPIKPAALPPVADAFPPKSEPLVAKTDPAATPAEQPTVKAETTTPPKPDPNSEPPAPVALPPSEPPVAVAAAPGPPRVAQIIPAPVGISSLERAPSALVQPPAAAPEAAPPDAVPAAEDWHLLVNRGDMLMQQRQRDDALEAYLNAFDLATDGRPVAAADVAQLCKRVANFQVSFGSLAEARQTLEHGRQTLKRMTGGKDAADRQKYVEQIENTLRSLPRE
ncbi:MAG: hypothetical protein WDN28_07565 [Chthoniobacter sp.]